jgi:hypothetical protein
VHIFSYFAYLDPSAGSVVFQSIIGIVAGVGVFGRKVFSGLGHRVKGIFNRTESSKSAEK